MTRTLTAAIRKEDHWYVADCPEVETVKAAVANLKDRCAKKE